MVQVALSRLMLVLLKSRTVLDLWLSNLGAFSTGILLNLVSIVVKFFIGTDFGIFLYVLGIVFTPILKGIIL